MKDSQIDCFLEAADRLNFTEAAEALNLSQSALSRQIAAMEEELGFQLFLRIKKRIYLSDPGKLYLEGLRSILRSHTELVDRAKMMERSISGTLKIGYLEERTVSPETAAAVSEISRRYPNIDVRLEYYGLKELLTKLENRQLDIGFTLDFDISRHNRIGFKTLKNIQIYLAIPGNHKKAEEKKLSLADFAEETFITISKDESYDILDLLNSSCKKAGFLPKVRLAPTLRMAALWVEAGMGISALDDGSTIWNNPNFKFIRVPEIKQARFLVAWNKEHLSSLSAVFLNILFSSPA